MSQDHTEVIKELAAAMLALEVSGVRVRVAGDSLGRWYAACAHGHDGIVDNTELSRARAALGDAACAKIYAEQRALLAGRQVRPTDDGDPGDEDLA